jgi:hypothetical protein
MEDDEPLRQLSKEEFEVLRSEILKSREAATQGDNPPPKAEKQSAPSGEAAVENRQAMELGNRIWERRKKGVSRFEIHRRLAIPLGDVDELLQQFEKRFYPDVGSAMHHYASLDDARLEALIHRYLPVAVGPAIEIEKVGRNGETYTELDTDAPVKAATLVLGAIAHRIELLAACRPESAGGKDSSTTNTLIWLQAALPSVSRVVEEVGGNGAGKTLELECAAELDIKSTNGSNR